MSHVHASFTVIAAALLALSACGSGGGDSAAPSAPLSPTTAETPATDPAPTQDDGASSAPTSDATAEGDATQEPPVIKDGDLPIWTFPANVPGWNLKMFDQNGLNQLSNEAGCLFTSSQNYHPSDAAASDEETSTQLAEQLAAALEAQGTGTSTFGRGTVPTGVPDQGPTEMIQVDTDYSANGQDYRSRVLARTFNARNSWVSLQYACPADAFDEAEFDDLRGRVGLTYVEPSSL